MSDESANGNILRSKIKVHSQETRDQIQQQTLEKGVNFFQSSREQRQ